MDELLEEKERLENELWNINMKITELKIKDEQKRLRDICNKTNKDFMRGLDFIFMLNIMSHYNYRAKGSMYFMDMAKERLGVEWEDMEKLSDLYYEFVGYYDFEFFEDIFDLGLKIKRGEIEETELVINRP